MAASPRLLPHAAMLIAAVALAACAGGWPTTVKPPVDTTHTTVDTVPLRVYGDARGRWIGAATGSVLTMPGDSGNTLRSILGREFSMLWSGTYLKFDYLRPSRTTYNYASADAVHAFAQSHAMVMRGHTLVWYQQIPSWLINGGYGPDTVKAILKDHIDQVMGHYRGKMAAWDVVNEAMGDDGNLRTATSFWWQNVGPDYIAQAFRWAHAADSTAVLNYNDYAIETINAKSTAVLSLLSDLKGRGVPIDGIGFQFHYAADQAPSTADIAANFARFAALGLKIQITEADMRVRTLNGVPISSADLQTQATAYHNMVDACLQTPACNAIEIEGIYDGQAWVNDPTQWGAPVLYDLHMQPKPAYYAVKAALKP